MRQPVRSRRRTRPAGTAGWHVPAHPSWSCDGPGTAPRIAAVAARNAAVATRSAAVAARNAAVAAEPIAAHRAAPSAGASAVPTAAHTAARIADPWAPRGSGHSVPASDAGAAARTLAGSPGRDGADPIPVEVAAPVAPAWAALTAARTVASTAARTAVSIAGREAAPTTVGRAARRRAPAGRIVGRTAAPMRAADPWADRVAAAKSANVPPAALPRGPYGRDLCGSGGPYRGGHQPPLSSIRYRRSIRHRCSNLGRGRPTRVAISNGRRPVGSPRISGCPGRVQPAAWPGMRTRGWPHQPMIDRPGIDRPTIDRPTMDRPQASAAGTTAAAARAARRTNERVPATRCAIRRDCGARSIRSPLPAGCRHRFVAVRSHTNTHRYRRRPTPFRVHPVRTANPPYGCGRHGRATDTTRVPLGWEDLIGHSSAPDGRPHHVCTTDFKPDIAAFVTERPLWTLRSPRTPCAARRCPTSAWRVSPHPAAPAGRDTAVVGRRRRVRSARPPGLPRAASPRRHA